MCWVSLHASLQSGLGRRLARQPWVLSTYQSMLHPYQPTALCCSAFGSIPTEPCSQDYTPTPARPHLQLCAGGHIRTTQLVLFYLSWCAGGEDLTAGPAGPFPSNPMVTSTFFYVPKTGIPGQHWLLALLQRARQPMLHCTDAPLNTHPCSGTYLAKGSASCHDGAVASCPLFTGTPFFFFFFSFPS